MEKATGVTFSYLTPRFATTILPSFLETSIPVCSDDPIIEPCAINEAHGIFCTGSCVISGTPGVKDWHRLFKFHNTHTSHYSTNSHSACIRFAWHTMKKRILYKTKSTGCLLDFIQTNDDSLYVSTFWKQLMHLDTSKEKKQSDLMSNLQTVWYCKQNYWLKLYLERRWNGPKEILPAPQSYKRKDFLHIKCVLSSVASLVRSIFPEHTKRMTNQFISLK